MSLSILSLSLTIALHATGGPAASTPPHSSALINDPKSHGQVGDQLLSLNEVILINQRQLAISSLSAAEQAQILGFGPDVAIGDIDATVVPRITLERDLDTIIDTPHGLLLNGSFGLPTIDLAQTRGFVVTSNFFDLRNVRVENAAVAVDVTQTDTIYGSTFENVTFRNISDTAIRLRVATDDGETRLDVTDCDFLDVPRAVEVFDTGTNRRGHLIFIGNIINGGQLGLGVHVGPDGWLNANFERTVINGTVDGVVFDRPTQADTRLLNITGMHVRMNTTRIGFAVEGHAAVTDFVTLRMFDLTGPNALVLSSRSAQMGSQMSAIIEDSRLTGGVTVTTGTGPGTSMANLRVRNGTLQLAAAGAPVTVEDSIFDNVAISTQGSSLVLVAASRFVGGSLTGTANAPIRVTGSHMAGAATGNDVTIANGLGNAQLGSMDVSPLDPRTGTSMMWTADLPPSVSGLWILGLAETLPFIGPRPLHLYFFLTFHLILPFNVRGQSQLAVPLPNDPSLIGWDFVLQLAVVPDLGSPAPALSLPPGRLLRIR